MTKLMETIRVVRRRLNPDLQVTGIIACMYDGRTKLAQEVCANIEEYFPGKMFKSVIRKNVKLAESPSHGKPISGYDRNSRGCKDYMALAREVDAQADKAPISQSPNLPVSNELPQTTG
jgi:chromosome partitioning protein